MDSFVYLKAIPRCPHCRGPLVFMGTAIGREETDKSWACVGGFYRTPECSVYHVVPLTREERVCAHRNRRGVAIRSLHRRTNMGIVAAARIVDTFFPRPETSPPLISDGQKSSTA